MRTFVLLTKLASPDASVVEIGAKHSDRARTSNNWLKDVRDKCPNIRFKLHYALMGYWDSMHVYEAPDEESAALVSLLARSHGAAQVESWLAMPYDRIMKISDELKCPDDEDNEKKGDVEYQD